MGPGMTGNPLCPVLGETESPRLTLDQWTTLCSLRGTWDPAPELSVQLSTFLCRRNRQLQDTVFLSKLICHKQNLAFPFW
jgi:hypothetical protein